MEIQTVYASRGLAWITEGFGLFRRDPLIWIVMVIIFLALITFASFIPIVGSVVSLMLQPVLVGGMQLGCRALEEGAALRIEHLFDGFRQNTRELALVGLYAALGYLLIGALILLAVGGGILGLRFLDSISNTPELEMDGALIGTAMAVLVGMTLAVPIMMATWFAPALVVFHGLPAWTAMKLSFTGCLRNMLPFLIYTLAVLLLGVVAMIPAGLGILILGPTLVGSVYAGHQDIFTARLDRQDTLFGQTPG